MFDKIPAAGLNTGVQNNEPAASENKITKPQITVYSANNTQKENELVCAELEDDEPVLPPDELDVELLEPEPVLPPDDYMPAEFLSLPVQETAANKETPAEQKNPQSGPSTGKVSTVMLEALKDFEGCKLKAYKDSSGVWTIGCGHTNGVKAGQTITEEQALKYLEEDLQNAVQSVTDAAAKEQVDLTQGQFDALVSFTYNCGPGSLNKSGLLKYIKKGDIDSAAKKMKQYVKSGGKVSKGLTKRREVETKWLYA